MPQWRDAQRENRVVRSAVIGNRWRLTRWQMVRYARRVAEVVTAAAVWLELVVAQWKADSDFRNNVVREENELGHAVFALSELLSIVPCEAAPEPRGRDGVPKGPHGCVVF